MNTKILKTVSLCVSTGICILGCSMNLQSDPDTGETFKCPYFSGLDYTKHCIDRSEGEVADAVLTLGGQPIPIGKRMFGDDTSSFGLSPGYFFLRELDSNDICGTILRAEENPATREISGMHYEFRSKSGLKYCNAPTVTIEKYTYAMTNRDSSVFKDDQGPDHGKVFSASYKYEWDGKKLEFNYKERRYTEFVDK